MKNTYQGYFTFIIFFRLFEMILYQKVPHTLQTASNKINCRRSQQLATILGTIIYVIHTINLPIQSELCKHSCIFLNET